MVLARAFPGPEAEPKTPPTLPPDPEVGAVVAELGADGLRPRTPRLRRPHPEAAVSNNARTARARRLHRLRTAPRR
ncbi:hypothetical protein H3146_11590 [Streptomyces sp. OF3]|uniref:Uncharacterized protein n=1 Tax=Streptomyces alkaliterrae TaxID=2213162 RepID=A0A7W3ZMK1_9ACTN|nr:hypothetical protein [Streptomyces alkaliterrae]MBB1254004.1 hypothetical protein [Streptomyces alkaliterrae]